MVPKVWPRKKYCTIHYPNVVITCPNNGCNDEMKAVLSALIGTVALRRCMVKCARAKLDVGKRWYVGYRVSLIRNSTC